MDEQQTQDAAQQAGDRANGAGDGAVNGAAEGAAGPAADGAAGEGAAGLIGSLRPENVATFWENNSDMIVGYIVSAAGAIVFLIVAFIVAAWVRRIVIGSSRRAKVDETLTRFLGTVARWTIVIIAIVAALEMFGIKTASFVVVLGAAGLAIGLAFQGSLANLASGVMLLLFRPFKVSDAVNVAGQLGVVDEIGLVSTTMDTFDNRRIIIPNSQVFGAVIENMSFNNERRADVDVGVAYSASIDQTREILEKAGASVEGRLQHRDVAVILMGLGASSVDWQVRVWAPASDLFPVKQATIRAVKNALDEAGIGIPFPQMDVHMDGRLGSGEPA